MKNYVKLSPAESLEYLVTKYNQAIADITGNDKNTCDARNCLKVSITVPTHRVSPEYKKDSLTLKNQIAEAEKELLANFDKKLAFSVIENIKEAEQSINYSLNLEGLVLYAGCDFGTVVKLPVKLEAETIIGAHFDLRPLYKARQQAESYYILTISQQKIRLMQAFNRVITQEFDNADFPFINTHYYTTDPEKLMQDIFTNNLIKEFFNVSDKRMREYIIENPLPIILAGDVKSVAYYQEMMDDDRLVAGVLSGNFDDAPTHEIVKQAYPIVEEYRTMKLGEYMGDIKKALDADLARQDVKDIYTVAKEGNVNTLYMGNRFSQKGQVKDKQLIIDVKNTDSNNRELALDIIDEVQSTGGSIIFLDDAVMEEFGGMVAVKRY